MAVESLWAAKEAIDQASSQAPFDTIANTYLIRARIYGAMLNHPKGHPEIDRSRPLTIAPTYDALKKYEALSGQPAKKQLWRTLLKQTFIQAFEAEEQLKERKSVELTLQGAYIIAYLKERDRAQSFKDFDKSFASLFVQILRRDVSKGNLQRAATLVPLTQQWYPDDGALWLTYVNFYIRNNERDKALQAARKAIQLNENATDPVRKQLYFTAGNLAVKATPIEAIEYFEKAVAIDSAFYGAIYNIGVIYAKLGRGVAEQALEAEKQNNSKVEQLVQQKEKYFQQALPHLEKAYELKPSAALSETISNIYLDLGNRPKALQWRNAQP